MYTIGTVLPALVGLYALVTGIFLISENRRPQSTLAWMLAFLAVPGLGVVAYFFFGRDRKAFSKESKLLRQDLEASARPGLSSILSTQESVIVPTEGVDSRRRRLMMLVKRNSHSAFVLAGEVQLQQDAGTFYPSLLADMKAARHSIHHQYFIWGADAFTEELKDVMIAKAKEGVEVRLLYDPVGSFFYITRRYLRELRAGGVHVAPTTPLYWLHTLNYRNHRKITIIDGSVGYTGGMNIGSEHLDGGSGFKRWRDTQMRIIGDGAAILQAVFMVDWYNAVHENLFSTTSCWPVETPSGGNKVPVQILTSGPDSQWAAIKQLYAFMIGSAQRRVFVQSPFFIPDATIAEALSLAALAGVDVRLMVSRRASGSPLPEWAGNTYFADIVDAGVRVFLYEDGYLHAKTIAVDSEICSVGSANIDIRSFSVNYELNAVLYSEQLTRDLEEQFERDMAHCTEFDLSVYRAQGSLVRFRDSMTRLLSPLL